MRARVRNGRLVVDEPTDLADGTEVELLEQELTNAEIVAKLRGAPPGDERLSPEEAAELVAIRARGEFKAHADVRRRFEKRR